jgi:Tfp pilus assembly protein PilN
MKLRLNLATSPQENRRPFLAAATVLGTLGIIALALLATASYRSWQANRQINADISRVESQIRTSSGQQAELEVYFHTDQAQKTLQRANFLNSLIGERSFPWTKVFADLEQTLPAGVRVVAISPKLVNGQAQVTITVGAVNEEQKNKFFEAISKSKKFSEIQPTAERHIDQQGIPDKIILDLKAVYATT